MLACKYCILPVVSQDYAVYLLLKSLPCWPPIAPGGWRQCSSHILPLWCPGHRESHFVGLLPFIWEWCLETKIWVPGVPVAVGNHCFQALLASKARKHRCVSIHIQDPFYQPVWATCFWATDVFCLWNNETYFVSEIMWRWVATCLSKSHFISSCSSDFCWCKVSDCSQRKCHIKYHATMLANLTIIRFHLHLCVNVSIVAAFMSF